MQHNSNFHEDRNYVSWLHFIPGSKLRAWTGETDDTYLFINENHLPFITQASLTLPRSV